MLMREDVGWVIVWYWFGSCFKAVTTFTGSLSYYRIRFLARLSLDESWCCSIEDDSTN